MVASDESSELLRRRLRAEGKMDHWPYNGPAGFSQEVVRLHCVNNEPWQKVRRSMKGKYTHEKLAILKAWYAKGIIDIRKGEDSEHIQDHKITEIKTSTYVQVYNYLGALRRGGQLDDQNRIRKLV